MRDYETEEFKGVLGKLDLNQDSFIDAAIPNINLTEFSYFLTNSNYYSVIVNDYPSPIIDKASLLEALVYQAKLVTVHDLNWDALEEGLNDMVKMLSEFKGMCLIFRNGNDLRLALGQEFNVLAEIANGIKVKVILCN